MAPKCPTAEDRKFCGIVSKMLRSARGGILKSFILFSFQSPNHLIKKPKNEHS